MESNGARRLWVYRYIDDEIEFSSSLDLEEGIWIDELLFYQGYLYVSSNRGLKIYEFTSEHQLSSVAVIPEIENRVSLLGNYLRHLSYKNNVPYVAIYSLEDPLAPEFLGENQVHFSGVSVGNLIGDYIYSTSGGVLTISQLNTSPKLEQTGFNTDEDSSILLDTVMSDAEGDLISVEVSTAPEFGILEFDEDLQELMYTPNSDYSGEDTATIILSDVHGHSDDFELTFQVNAINDAPSVEHIELSVMEDSEFTGTINVVDPDDDVFSFSIETLPSNGVLVIDETGQFTYTPDNDFSGLDSFSITVVDANGESSVAGATVTIEPVNDLPTLETTSITTNEDVLYQGTLVGNDIEGENIFFGVKTEPLNGTLELDSLGEMTYRPHADFYGSDSITLTLTDSVGGVSDFTLSVVVVAVNDTPNLVIPIVKATEDIITELKLPGKDIDGDSLTYEISVSPLHGSAVISENNTLAYNASAQNSSSDTLTITMSDGVSESVDVVIQVDIEQVNDAPTIDTIEFSIDEDTTASLELMPVDPENDPVEIEVSGYSEGISSVDVQSDGVIAVTPIENYFGLATIDIDAKDQYGASNTYTLQLDVLNVDDAPTAQDTSVTLMNGETITDSLPTTDIDGETLEYSVESDASNGSLSLASNGQFTYTPNTEFSGDDEFTYRVTDNSGNSVIGTFTISVERAATPPPPPPVTSPPVSNSDSGGGSINTSIILICILLLSIRTRFRN